MEAVVVAYADRVFNEMGTIYQACNGLYTGKTDPKDQANYVVRGKWMSGWLVRREKYGSRSMETLRRFRILIEGSEDSPAAQSIAMSSWDTLLLKKQMIIRALAPLIRPYPSGYSNKSRQ